MTFTLLRNGIPTALSCTIAYPATSCTDPDSVTATATDVLVVEITQPGSGFARFARWSATFSPS